MLLKKLSLCKKHLSWHSCMQHSHLMGLLHSKCSNCTCCTVGGKHILTDPPFEAQYTAAERLSNHSDAEEQAYVI